MKWLSSVWTTLYRNIFILLLYLEWWRARRSLWNVVKRYSSQTQRPLRLQTHYKLVPFLPGILSGHWETENIFLIWLNRRRGTWAASRNRKRSFGSIVPLYHLGFVPQRLKEAVGLGSSFIAFRWLGPIECFPDRRILFFFLGGGIQCHSFYRKETISSDCVYRSDCMRQTHFTPALLANRLLQDNNSHQQGPLSSYPDDWVRPDLNAEGLTRVWIFWFFLSWFKVHQSNKHQGQICLSWLIIMNSFLMHIALGWD